MATDFVELFLTCEDRAEAEKIAQALLEQHLIACAKFIPIEARYWWKGEIVDGKEILLLMESAVENFDRIETEVAKLHSYETFVLQAIPLERVSKEASVWLTENTK